MASPLPTKIISWQNEVSNADPDWIRKYQRPIVYEFSNGRVFTWRPDTYTTLGP
jgi:hypothetical protein